jgi:hypothetical protein
MGKPKLLSITNNSKRLLLSTASEAGTLSEPPGMKAPDGVLGDPK